MQPVTIYFTDTTTLAAFILTVRPSKVQVNSSTHSLQGELTEDQLTQAKRDFNAMVKLHPSRHPAGKTNRPSMQDDTKD